MLLIPLGNSSFNFRDCVLFFACLHLKIYPQIIITRCLQKPLSLSYFRATHTKKPNQGDVILKPSPT